MADLEEWERGRLDTEWALVSAVREAINILLRRPDKTTYRQALNFGAVIAPSVLALEKRILDGLKESQEARYYRQMADAKTVSAGRVVTALELIEEEILKHKTLVQADPDAELLKGELKTLEAVRQEIRPKRHTENQLIIRDAITTNRDLPISGSGKGYLEYMLDGRRAMRTRVLHPDPPEHKIGADLVYEHYDVEDETVRLALIQYKLWDGRSLSQDPRMEKQLQKLWAVTCKGELCSGPDDRALWRYRFPHCAAFLRPTDRLQEPSSALISSGLHIPMCAVNFSWTDTGKGGKALKRSSAEGNAVSHRVFEELFNCSLLGTKKITWADLEKIYRKYDVFDQDETVVLHVQEFDYQTKKTAPKGRGRKRGA